MRSAIRLASISPVSGDGRAATAQHKKDLAYFPSVWGLSGVDDERQFGHSMAPQRLGIDGAQPHRCSGWRISPALGDGREQEQEQECFPSDWGLSAA